MSHGLFSGIWVALVTPFHHGEVDHTALQKLVRHYAHAKVAGLVALGTTGEAATLSDHEQDAVLDTVLSHAGTLPVMVGLAGVHQGDLLQRLRTLTSRPVAGVLIPAPYYVRPSQQGLVEHFTRLADASAQPVVIYDIPYRSAVTLALDTLLTLAGHPNIQAIKDCGGSLEKTQALIADARLAVLAGDDLNIFNTLCMGGQGAITAAAHLRPDLFVAMHQAIAAQRLTEAREIFHALAPMIQALFAEPNPSGVKAALHQLGWIENELRSPMMAASKAAQAHLAHALAALNLAATVQI